MTNLDSIFKRAAPGKSHVTIWGPSRWLWSGLGPRPACLSLSPDSAVGSCVASGKLLGLSVSVSPSVERVSNSRAYHVGLLWSDAWDRPVQRDPPASAVPSGLCLAPFLVEFSFSWS